LLAHGTNIMPFVEPGVDTVDMKNMCTAEHPNMLCIFDFLETHCTDIKLDIS
jgi:hypothetical protein